MRLALRGAVVVVAGTVLALLLSASGLESFRFSAARHHRLPHHRASRCSSACCSTALVWPLRRRVTDAQVAMYLEECDPTLEAAIISAVEATDRRRLAGALAAARREARRAGDRSVPRARRRPRHRADVACSVTRSTLAAIAAVAALHRRARPRVSAPRPVGAPRSSRAAPKRRARTASKSSPATRRCRAARIRRSSAKLVGFTAARRQRHDARRRRTRRSNACRSSPPPSRARSRACSSTSRSRPSTSSSRTASARRRSRSSVVDLPTVSQLDLEYRFPAYTGLAPRKAEGAATSPRSAAPRSSCTSCRR